MNAGLDLARPSALSGELTLTSYSPAENLSYEDWAEEGTTLATMARASMWWVGDWIRFGEAKYGEKYAQALDATGLTLGTLQNAVWVCSKIPPQERLADVPFSHHQEVAPIETSRRRELLGKAIDEGLTREQLRKAIKGAHVANNSGHVEWYTPAPFIEAGMKVMGGIDLDPCSCAAANRIVGADKFYDEQDNGLEQSWFGRVWMNPPYAAGLNDKFCTKLRDSYVADEVSEAIVVVNNATETGWFQTLGRVANAFCFPNGRISFWRPDRDSLSPLQGQAFIYLGEHVAEFRSVFGEFGLTVVS